MVVGDAGLDVLAIPAAEVALDSDTRAEVVLTAGGAGANTAAWLADCGARAVLLARVGADAAGREVREVLTGAGVECRLTTDTQAGTCCVVVVIDRSGRRTMLADRGASARLQPSDLDLSGIRAADHLHLSGYVLLDPSSRPAGLAALAAAGAAGVTTSVDPQAAALLTDVDQFLADIAGVDLLLPNADELSALTGSADPVSAQGLLSVVGAVATTRAEQGAVWVDRTGMVSVPARDAVYVDPTGCGDAFDAGFITALTHQMEPEAAIDFAQGVAALVASGLGSDAGVQSFDHTRERVAELQAGLRRT